MEIDLVAGNLKVAMKLAEASSSDLWKVPLSKIQIIDGFNVRSNGADHAEHLAGLVDSIMENGFYPSRPLAGYVAVNNGKQVIYLTDGHCRFEAAQEAIKRGAEIKTLPVVVSPKGTNIEDLTVGLVTQNSGKPLSQYEIATVCKRLISFGWETKQIAKRLAYTVQKIEQLLSLVGAPAAVQDLVVDGKVSATQAIKTLQEHGEKAVEKLEEGVKKAEEKGKKRATKRDIEPKPSKTRQKARSEVLSSVDTQLPLDAQKREEELLSSISELSAEVIRLKDRIAIEGMEISEEEKTDMVEVMAVLREQLKSQQFTIEALTKSRDALMRENNELKNQVSMQQRKLKKAA